MSCFREGPTNDEIRRSNLCAGCIVIAAMIVLATIGGLILSHWIL